MFRFRNLILLLASSWMLAACLGGADTDALAPLPPPSIEVSAIDAGSVSEGGFAVTLVFEFQLSEASANDINVTYETRNGTAESGADYVARSGTATISAGQLSTNVAITILDDSLDEPDEMFFVDISSLSEGVVAIASGAGNIIDEDAAPSVSIADGSLTEGNAGQADLVFPLSLSAPSGFDVTVDYSTANATATAGADYVAAAGQVIIPAGATSATINVGVIADVIDENNETFTVSLDAAVNAAISVGAATGTIVDDDNTVPPMVTASIAAAGTVSENPGGSSLTFPVTISMTSSADVTVQYQTAAGSAMSGADFVQQASSLVIPAGQLSGAILVAIIDDALDEPAESMSVNLMSVSLGVIGTGSAGGSIVDDDAPPTISVADATLAEGNSGQANLIFPLTLSAPSGFDISVDYQTGDTTATAGSDYSSTSGTATIGAGNVSTSISVAVLGDATFEPDELLGIAISTPVNVVVSDGSAVGTISNDDSEPTISIQDASLVEGDAGQSNMVFSVTLSSLTSVDVTFNYASSDTTATAGDDYTGVSSSGSVSAGTLTTTINVPVTGDADSESDETFALALSSVANASVNDGAAIGTITNDDVATTISISDASIVEGDSGQTNLSFTVSLSAQTAADVTFSYATSDISATAGDDYVAASAGGTITAGNLSTTVGVTVNGDIVAEGNETFGVSISGVANATVADAAAIGTITNDDVAPTISISDASMAEGDSGQANLSFTVSLNAQTAADVTFSYATSDMSATAGDDYVATSSNSTITAGNLTIDVTVPVVGDTDVESDESFTLSLSNVANATVNDGAAVGTITNDDGAPAISIADASIVEGDSGQSQLAFTVTISSQSASDVTFDFSTANSSATAGDDYVTTSSSSSVTAGNLTVDITVPVIGDTDVESDENFSISLSNVANATVADGTAIGTITNDDVAPTISIADASIAEGDSGQTILSFTVSLSTQTPEDVTFGYATSDMSATAGDDYVATSSNGTITAGNLTVDIAVPVNGDTDVESDESFTLSLSSVANATVNDGTAVGTITNDDVAPTISIADASIAEGDSGQTNLSFTVSLSTQTPEDVTFSYVTSDISATAGDDYVATSSSSSVTAGNLTVDITVPVAGDTDVEFDESFTLSLSNVANATVTDGTAIGTIANDDVAPTISIADASIIEGDSGQSQLAFTVTISSQSASDVTFDYSTTNSSATAGDDYVATSSSSSVTAGNLTVDITVPVNGDVDVESDESFTLSLSNVANATVADGSAIGTITNDDVAPTISIADASIIEGDSGQSQLAFTVTISSQSASDVTFDFSTANSSATAGDDYVATSSNSSITAGNLTVDITVPVNGDTDVESDESFTLSLSNVANATVADGTAIGTITNDDVAPTISISDASIAEGDSGQINLSFTVSLSAQAAADVTFSYATSDISATAGDDYVAAAAGGIIAAGNLSTTVGVTVNGDIVEEGNETFGVSISGVVNATVADGNAIGTITNDDSAFQSGLEIRPSNLTCLATDQPILNTSISTQVAFTSLPSLAQPVGLLHAPGDFSQWYVVEQAGRILRFDNNSSTSTVSDFIDIRSPGDPIDVKSSGSETGLLGMAFHPDYGNGNWFVYLYYMIDGGSAGANYFSVVSRFESKDNGLTLDAADAVELLRLDQPYSNHNGGHIEFGPDGYLYIALGDGGSGGDPGDRSQNTSNLFGTVLRVDVDSGSPYGIPGDNPFIGNSLCDDGQGAVACPEIYAWGLRNPWKFSFDDATGQLWLGDVGQDAREEINIIELGGNYGWRCREGSQNYNPSGICPADLIDPIIEYPHGVGNSITGGVVYRGVSIPELAGRFVFADYAQGKIFASTDEGNGGYDYEQLLDTSHFISAFAHEQNGELLYLNYGSGEIRRIVQSGGNSNDPIPDKLSATGCVNASNPTLPADGLIPYDVNALFWSDGAVKERWYSIPDATTIDVSADGDWQFPVGTVLVKNFRLNNALIETRLFMRHTNGEWGGYTYEWNGAGTDADRVIGGKQATKAGQEWIYPSGAECMQCHTAAAGFSLGLEHGQLNKDLTYPSTGQTGNQLYTADFVDLLTNPLGDVPANLPRFADPADTGETLDARARAYLHTNCAGCHRPGGPTPSDMDLRHATPLASSNTCEVTPTSGDLGISGARLVDPGSPATSLIIERAARRDSHGMPPLGSNLIDTQGVQLLTGWVNSLGACP